MKSRFRSRGGFTLLELFVLIIIGIVLFCMLLPATRGSVDGSRRAKCQNNLRKVALGVLNYELAHGCLPPARGCLSKKDALDHSDGNQLSGLVFISPFLPDSKISQPADLAVTDAWHPTYPKWNEEFEVLRCPSAAGGKGEFGRTNYVFCIGDMARGINNPSKPRGAFAVGRTQELLDVTDGTSNTLALGETGTQGIKAIGNYATNQSSDFLDDPSKVIELVEPERPKRSQHYLRDVKRSKLGRGGNWADGSGGNALFNTVLPPGSPSVAVGGSLDVDGLYSTGSNHADMVQVAYLDGSTHVILNSIDAGDSSNPTLMPDELEAGSPTPHGVWGQLGTAAGNDPFDSLGFFD